MGASGPPPPAPLAALPPIGASGPPPPPPPGGRMGASPAPRPGGCIPREGSAAGGHRSDGAPGAPPGACGRGCPHDRGCATSTEWCTTKQPSRDGDSCVITHARVWRLPIDDCQLQPCAIAIVGRSACDIRAPISGSTSRAAGNPHTLTMDYRRKKASCWTVKGYR